ncbi:hypothetical protein COZ60_02340 [Candidatus Bathyarchaeota archaeon CG_4_8_14_3_um_filter_42_8]|nr:MAG: hypothetical protein COZ60_02340 [Candidatus Bathyarchaeota archaeon CG_4_8_14_3_um_filter_42_8]
MISIRLAKPDEFDNVKHFIQSLFPNTIIYLDDEDLLLLAESNNRLVGFAHFTDIEECVIVKGVGVDPSLRGHGIGSMLMGRVIEMSNDNIRPIYLKAKSMNPAIDLYLRYGFFLKKFGPVSTMVRKPNH